MSFINYQLLLMIYLFCNILNIFNVYVISEYNWNYRMSLSIGTNIAALNAASASSSAQRAMETAMVRLSTGKRINSAKDDPAGLAISSRLESSIKGVQQSTRNALDAQSLLNTAEGGLEEIDNILQRIRELTVSAANDTNSASDRSNLNNEAQQLLAGIDAIASSTTWAGQNLLDGTFLNKSFQVGGSNLLADTLSTSVADVSSSSLNLLNIFNTPKKTGGVFQVNTFTVGDQGNPVTRGPGSSEPVVASHTDGSYVVIWTSDGQDGSLAGIFGQLYNSDNSQIGSEFLVNTTTSSDQYNPDVEFFSDGSFIVAWQNMGSVNTGINAQLFSKSGAKQGGELVVRSTTNAGRYAERVPSLEVLSDDTAIVTWSSFQQYTGGYSYDIYGQMITSAGANIGSAFQITPHSTTQGNTAESSVTQLTDGNLMVAYTDYFTLGNSGQSGVYVQKINASGIKIGGEVEIYFEAGLDSYDIEISTLSNGGFAASWTVWDQPTTDYKVYTQVFDNDGAATSLAKQLESTNIAPVTSIVSTIDGGYFLSWSQSDDGGNSSDIYGQKFSSNGEVVGERVQLSTNLSGLNQAASLGASDDAIIAAWVSSTIDGSGNGIAAQKLSSGHGFQSSLSANNVMNSVDAAIQMVSTERTRLGAMNNRLNHIVANNTNAEVNFIEALGRIQDADYASEATALARYQILTQAANAMIAQANSSQKSL